MITINIIILYVSFSSSSASLSSSSSLSPLPKPHMHTYLHIYMHISTPSPWWSMRPCIRWESPNESPNSARNLLVVRGLISSCSIVSAMFSNSPTFTPCAYIYIHTYAHTPHVELSPYMMTQIHACLSRSHGYYIFLNWYITFKPVGTWFLKTHLTLTSRAEWCLGHRTQDELTPPLALLLSRRGTPSQRSWVVCVYPQVRDVFVGFAVAVVWRVSHCVCISKNRCSSYVSHGLRATFEWDSF